MAVLLACCVLLMSSLLGSAVAHGGDHSIEQINATFTPWEIMGPMKTTATGYALFTYKEDGYDYEIHLYGATGVKNVEIHVGEPGTHGAVVAVLFASPFSNMTTSTNGLVCKGTLDSYDLIGPLLLPVGEHLEVTELRNRYVLGGYAEVVVHTYANPGGELAARLRPSSMAAAPGLAPAAGQSTIAAASLAPTAAGVAPTASQTGTHTHG